MLYRIVTVVIVIFWITMTGLLLRKELGPDANALREVPVSHVMNLLFTHGQESSLNIQSERQHIGRFQIHPQIRKEDGKRILDFTGRLQVTIPGLARQRLAWRGDLVMDRTLAAQVAHLTISFTDPSAYAVDLTIEPPAKRLRYETRVGDRVLDQGEYALDEQGALTWLREQNIDPDLIQRFRKPGGPGPSIKAWHSTMEIAGQQLETFRVAVEQGGQTLIEFHVDHIGHILEAKSFLGYTAAPDDHLP